MKAGATPPVERAEDNGGEEDKKRRLIERRPFIDDDGGGPGQNQGDAVTEKAGLAHRSAWLVP